MLDRRVTSSKDKPSAGGTASHNNGFQYFTPPIICFCSYYSSMLFVKITIGGTGTAGHNLVFNTLPCVQVDACKSMRARVCAGLLMRYLAWRPRPRKPVPTSTALPWRIVPSSPRRPDSPRTAKATRETSKPEILPFHSKNPIRVVSIPDTARKSDPGFSHPGNKKMEWKS